jgi:hypothetical protein
MTKKAKILKMFNDADWVDLRTHDGRRGKIITYEMLWDAGLNPTSEYGETYNDVKYAQNIFNKMGYKVTFGMCMYVHERAI